LGEREIGELSGVTGASPRSLRYYEELGLISSARKSNGYREYDESAIDIVKTIRSLLDLGFPTSLIERILPCTGDTGPIKADCTVLIERVAESATRWTTRPADWARPATS